MNKKILFTLSLFSILVFLSACGGGGGGSVSGPPGGTPDVPAAVRLSVSQFSVQTGSTISLRAKVLDATGKVLPGVSVSFASSFGTLSAASAPTNTNGIATVTISSASAGSATITASSSALSDSKTVQFSSSIGSGAPSITLDVITPADSILFNPSNNQFRIRATVYNAGGSLAPMGTPISWSSDSSAVQFDNTLTNTVINGSSQADAYGTVTSSSFSAFVNIIATSNGATNMKTLSLNSVTVNPATSFLTANPLTINTGGTSAVTAVVKVTSGSPAPNGTTVNFTTTCGIVTPFSQTTGGVATATFTAPLSTGPCTVTGKVAGVTVGTVGIQVTTPLNVIPNSRTVSGTGAVTFTVSGGTGPYTATSDNPRVTVTAGTFASTLTATVVSMPPADETVTLTVYDSAVPVASKTATLNLDVGALTPLTVLPTTQFISKPTTLSPAVLFTITGGTGPYTATSSNPGLVSVSLAALGTSPLTATVVGTVSADTDITITVFDAVAASKTVTLKLDVPPLSGADVLVSPASITLTGINEPPATSADNVTFTISGGTGPYSMFSDNNVIIASQGALGAGVTTFTIDPTAVIASTTVTLTVTDFLGVSKTASVIVKPSPATLALSPASITVPVSTAVNLYILNGASGAFDLYSSDTTCVTAPLSPLAALTTSFTINTTASGTCASTITIVSQANGQVATSTITVP